MMGPQLATLRRSRRRRSGQAAVESALVLPLALFLILGSIQLFLMFQARVMAEYAAYRATRAGSMNHGSCEAMNHAALAALLPTFRKTTNPAELGEAFGAVKENRFGGGYGLSTGLDISNEEVVWIFREQPTNITTEDPDFAYLGHGADPMQLQIALVFWYPMRIPFADWVIFRMAMASMGLEAYTAQNPLLLTQRADWDGGGPTGDHLTQHGQVLSRMQANIGPKRYLFPIRASHTMRMMTPAKPHHFSGGPNCF